MSKLPHPEHSGEPPALSPRRTAAIFASMLLILFFAALDQTIVSTALPKITAELNGLEHFAWVATAYMLTSTITVPIYGKISDLIGRKIVLMFGIALFLAGSLWCAQATSMHMLIAARALQGLGAGGLMPVAFAIVGNLYSPREIGKYQAFIAIAFVLASVVGPPVGGWITDAFGWRWAFYVNLPIGLIASALLLVLMPSFKGKAMGAIDYLGALLLVTALSLLLFALNGTAAIPGLSKPLVWALAFAFTLAFTAWEYRVQEPILNPRLFGNSIIGVSAVVTAFTGAIMLSTTFYLPAFLQVVLGHSASTSGYLVMPFSIAIGVSASLSGYHASHTGKYRWNAIIGSLLVTCGLGLVCWFLSVDARSWQILLSTCVLGLGLGVCVSLYGTIVRNAVSVARLGEAMAGLTLCRQLGSTTGMAISGAIIGVQVASHSWNPAQSGINSTADAASKLALTTGIQHAYAVLFLLSLASFILLVVGLKEIPLRHNLKENTDHHRE